MGVTKAGAVNGVEIKRIKSTGFATECAKRIHVCTTVDWC
jgi:hypothetical protein